jgi:hypothetical protein
MYKYIVCNICSCLAALKHLKFIVCGSYVKQVWPPLIYDHVSRQCLLHCALNIPITKTGGTNCSSELPYLLCTTVGALVPSWKQTCSAATETVKTSRCLFAGAWSAPVSKDGR